MVSNHIYALVTIKLSILNWVYILPYYFALLPLFTFQIWMIVFIYLLKWIEDNECYQNAWIFSHTSKRKQIKFVKYLVFISLFCCKILFWYKIMSWLVSLHSLLFCSSLMMCWMCGCWGQFNDTLLYCIIVYDFVYGNTVSITSISKALFVG